MRFNCSFPPVLPSVSCPTPRLLIYVFLQITSDFDRVCPKCKSIAISTRTRKKPKYKCQHCDNEFDNPKAKIEYKTFKQKSRQYSYLDE